MPVDMHTDPSAIAGCLVDEAVVLPASLLQPVPDLVARSHKGDPVHAGHDGLFDQLAIHIVSQHSGFRNAFRLIFIHPLLYQLCYLCVHILQCRSTSVSVTCNWEGGGARRQESSHQESCSRPWGGSATESSSLRFKYSAQADFLLPLVLHVPGGTTRKQSFHAVRLLTAGTLTQN